MRSLLVLTAVFALGVSPARADSISATASGATMWMVPNTGTGDNVGFRFTGVGVDIQGYGGMACFEWCSGGPIAPGTSIGTSHIYLGGIYTTVVGGVDYPSDEFGFLTSPFDDIGRLNGSASGIVGSGETYSDFFLSLPTDGSWVLHFTHMADEQGNDAEAFVHGEFYAGTARPTPEPGPLGLTLVGLAGMWLAVRRSGARGV